MAQGAGFIMLATTTNDQICTPLVDSSRREQFLVSPTRGKLPASALLALSVWHSNEIVAFDLLIPTSRMFSLQTLQSKPELAVSRYVNRKEL